MVRYDKIKIKVIRAESLRKPDSWIIRQIDPYVELWYGGQSVSTSHVDDTANPVFNQSFTLRSPEGSSAPELQYLILRMMDKFEISMFVDAIGQTSIPIVGLTRGPMAIKLQHMQDGESHYAGTLFVEVENDGSIIPEELGMISTIKSTNPGNLMAKYWADDFYFRLPVDSRDVLIKSVTSGIECPESKIGFYAISSTGYEDFKPYVDGLLREIHGIKGEVKHLSSWDLARVDGLPPHGKLSLSRLGLPDSVMRVTVERNLTNVPLPAAMSQEQRVYLERLLLLPFRRLMADPYFRGSYRSLTPFSEHCMDDREYAALTSAGLMFGDLNRDVCLTAAGIAGNWPYGRGCYVSSDKEVVVWVGGENHLRVTCTGTCPTVNALFDRCQEVLGMIESSEGCMFAKSPTYGFITSSPLDLGTGMRASMVVNASPSPADLAHHMSKASKMGLATQLCPDGTVEISPIKGLMITEGEIMGLLYKGAKVLATGETGPEVSSSSGNSGHESSSSFGNKIPPASFMRSGSLEGTTPKPWESNFSSPQPHAPPPTLSPSSYAPPPYHNGAASPTSSYASSLAFGTAPSPAATSAKVPLPALLLEVAAGHVMRADCKEWVRAALAAGATGVVVSEDAGQADGGGTLYEAGMALREALAGHAGTTLLVRARPDIAGAVGADGVLLAGGSLPVLVARRTMQASAEGPECSRLVAKSVATLVAAKQAEREGAELLVLEGVDAKGLDEILRSGVKTPMIVGVFAHNGSSGWATKSSGAKLISFLDAGLTDGLLADIKGGEKHLPALKRRLTGEPEPAHVPAASERGRGVQAGEGAAATMPRVDSGHLLNEYERQLAELRRELVAAKSMPPLPPMSKDPSASEMSELVRKTNLAYNEMLAERMQKEDVLQEEVERLKRMLKSKENAVAGSVSLQERCNQLEEELRGVTEKCNTDRERDAYLAETKWKDQVETLSSQLKKASLKWKTLETAQGGSQELLTKIKLIDAELTKAKAEASTNKLDMDKSKKDLALSSKEKMKAMEDVGSMNKTLLTLQHKVKDLEGGATSEMEKLRKDLDTAVMGNKAKTTKLTTTERDLDRAKRLLEQGEKDREKQAEEKKEACDQIESLKRQLVDANGGGRTEIKMLRMELEAAKKNLATQVEANKGLQSKADKWENALTSVAEDQKSKNYALKASQETVTKLQLADDGLKASIEDLEKKLVMSREENAEERRSQEAQSVRFEDMENMVSHFDGRLQEKNLQIKELEAAFSRQQSELDALVQGSDRQARLSADRQAQVVEVAKAEVAQALDRLADVERQLEAAFVSNKEMEDALGAGTETGDRTLGQLAEAKLQVAELRTGEAVLQQALDANAKEAAFTLGQMADLEVEANKVQGLQARVKQLQGELEEARLSLLELMQVTGERMSDHLEVKAQMEAQHLEDIDAERALVLEVNHMRMQETESQRALMLEMSQMHEGNKEILKREMSQDHVQQMQQAHEEVEAQQALVLEMSHLHMQEKEAVKHRHMQEMETLKGEISQTNMHHMQQTAELTERHSEDAAALKRQTKELAAKHVEQTDLLGEVHVGEMLQLEAEVAGLKQEGEEKIKTAKAEAQKELKHATKQASVTYLEMAEALRAEQAGAVKALRQQMSEAAAKHMEDMEVLMAAHAHDMKALKASTKVHEAEHTDALEQASKRCKDDVKDFERRLKEVQEGHADVLLEAVAGKKAVTRLEAEVKAAEAAYQELEEDLRKARTAREMDMEMEEPARLEMEELRTQVDDLRHRMARDIEGARQLALEEAGQLALEEAGLAGSRAEEEGLARERRARQEGRDEAKEAKALEVAQAAEEAEREWVGRAASLKEEIRRVRLEASEAAAAIVLEHGEELARAKEAAADFVAEAVEPLEQALIDQEAHHLKEIHSLKVAAADEQAAARRARQAVESGVGAMEGKQSEHRAEVAELREAHNTALSNLKHAHAAQVAESQRVRLAFTAEVADLTETHNAELDQAKERHVMQVDSLRLDLQSQAAAVREGHVGEASRLAETNQAEMARLKAAHAAEMAAQAALLESRVACLRAEWEKSAVDMKQEVQKSIEAAAAAREAAAAAIEAAREAEAKAEAEASKAVAAVEAAEEEAAKTVAKVVKLAEAAKAAKVEDVEDWEDAEDAEVAREAATRAEVASVVGQTDGPQLLPLHPSAQGEEQTSGCTSEALDPAAEAPPDAITMCGGCRRELDADKLCVCGGCGKTGYCSQKCQKRHWKAGHKAACQSIV